MTAQDVIRVLDPGPLTLVEDRGRPGLAALGVSGSGAYDRAAHRLAQRLVGNDESMAGLEHLLGGLRLALPAGCWFAVTGAWGPMELAPLGQHGSEGGRRLQSPAHPVEPHRATWVESPSELRIGSLERGLRTTIAVRGGLAMPATLGSRSYDSLAGLGPAPLTAGDLLPIGPSPADPVPPADLVPVDLPPAGSVELAVRPGPRRDWFDDAAWELLLSHEWSTSTRSDRTGVRLDGPGLRRTPEFTERELPSEGMLRGSIQVSPDGAPTVLGPDHPVTGGYPVIAVVTDRSLDRIAQLRPGQPVRLRLATGRR